MHLHKRFGALAILAVSVLVFAGVAAAATVDRDAELVRLVRGDGGRR